MQIFRQQLHLRESKFHLMKYYFLNILKVSSPWLMDLRLTNWSSDDLTGGTHTCLLKVTMLVSEL